VNRSRVFENRVERRLFELERKSGQEDRANSNTRSFVICVFTKYYKDNPMGENKVGGACSMHGKYEKKEQNISRKT
jgi:hypothetical protein